jgi:hypothetical protein
MLLKPFDDGSALLRAAGSAETFPPPNGPKEAVEWLAAKEFTNLESEVGRAIAAGVEPPMW